MKTKKLQKAFNEAVRLFEETTQPITDELIQELVNKGEWLEETLNAVKSLGWRYKKSTDAVVAPPEWVL